MQVTIPPFKKLPVRLARLTDLAYNLWWCWNVQARRLFQSLDRMLWVQLSQNPVRVLQELSEERFAELANDPSFLQLYDEVVSTFDQYMGSRDTWFSETYPERVGETVAYFCAEFAVHTSVPIYSGGLGLLSGDTCKEASDLGVPFIAVGALYPEGYFKQKVAADGSQEVFYERLRIDQTPLLPVLDDEGNRLVVPVPVDGRSLKVALFRLQIGRVPIYLMDSNIPENEPWDRDLVARLYAGDNEVRLRQEIVLGIGGVRVLRALGHDPVVIHLNEGHPAFAALELIREAVAAGRDFSEAVEDARRRLVFTTHTPVKAGHDEFPHHMMEQHFRRYWEELGISREDFFSLGSLPGSSSFSMAVLALRTSRRANAVSVRHSEVAREMWGTLYPERPAAEVPIIAVTNGVHVPTWLAGSMIRLYDRYLAQGWREQHDSAETWEPIASIPDEELWEHHLYLKRKLIRYMRNRTRNSWMTEGGAAGQIVAGGTLLSADVLTIVFARRFATYKRAALFLRDPERLKRILLDPWRPVQFIFAGKPHPADEPGKYLLRLVYEAAASPQYGGRIAFIENYDKQVAHHLVAGADVWLNNPEPPKEASGTSGQKASLNGVINFSVLDGWWCEGYNGRNGWAIDGTNDDSTARSIYEQLENEIVPEFYDRDSQNIPRAWVRRMKESIISNAAPFSARRMVKEYLNNVYFVSNE